jgi:hypothetical protein
MNPPSIYAITHPSALASCRLGRPAGRFRLARSSIRFFACSLPLAVDQRGVSGQCVESNEGNEDIPAARRYQLLAISKFCGTPIPASM